MRKLLGSLLTRRAGATGTVADLHEQPPQSVSPEGTEPFLLISHLERVNGLPYLDWSKVTAWVETLSNTQQQIQAWSLCEKGWLLHLGAALGPQYRVLDTDSVTLLSTLKPETARKAAALVERTLRRIVHLLGDITHVPEWGKDVLIVFDNDEDYYRYVSRYYPEEGEFARSSGMFIAAGCAHFVAVKGHLESIEPVIAHELTHSCVSHLPLPAWLNEGIAVNTEHQIVGLGSREFSPREMHDKHVRFWGQEEIQEFWSGKSFLRSDEGNMLSYDLARIMVDQMAREWQPFRGFVLAADLTDSGAAAAHEHLRADLGAYVCALIEKDERDSWSPNPSQWPAEPERGGF